MSFGTDSLINYRMKWKTSTGHWIMEDHIGQCVGCNRIVRTCKDRSKLIYRHLQLKMWATDSSNRVSFAQSLTLPNAYSYTKQLN